ncbi:MAG: tonB2 [Betaproteobacteria bacterium]|nr:tonB2 [Betaproteobacteria bacterium]
MSFAEAFTQTFPAPDWWRRMDLSQRILTGALVLSTVAHGGVLALQFSIPDEFRLQSRDTPLDVILVNARHASKPSKAEALAQANLDGGGDAARGRAQSFLTASKHSQDGDQLQAASSKVQQLEIEQKRLLSAIQDSRSKIAVPPPQQAQPDPLTRPNQVSPNDAQESAQAILREEAEIAKRIADENARPKRGYITPSTREVEFATYYKHWADQVERIGNSAYPDKARGGTYRLTMTVSVQKNGRVEKIEIEKSSGIKEIDNAARRIVKLGEPYDKFTQQMLSKYGVLDLTMAWTFSRTEALSVETQHQP